MDPSGAERRIASRPSPGKPWELRDSRDLRRRDRLNFADSFDISAILIGAVAFPLPLQIVLKDREKGEAELRAKKTLNCEKKKNYKFDIVAVSCAGLVSEK